MNQHGEPPNLVRGGGVLNVKCLSQAHEFECLILVGRTFAEELGGVDLLEKVSLGL